MEQLREVPLWEHPFRTLFCGTLFNGTLWYLYAMLWTWLFLYLVKRARFIQQSYALIPVLLAVHILWRLYIQKYSDMDINTWIYLFRSPFLYGIPFVLSGHFIAYKEEQIKNRFSLLKCTLFLICGGIVMVTEFMVWSCFMDIWLSTIMITTALFLFAVKYPEMRFFPRITEIGKKYSMAIYVSHIPLSRIMSRCLKPFIEEKIYGWVTPFLIIMTALLIAKAINKLRTGIKKRTNYSIWQCRSGRTP